MTSQTTVANKGCLALELAKGVPGIYESKAGARHT